MRSRKVDRWGRFLWVKRKERKLHEARRLSGVPVHAASAREGQGRSRARQGENGALGSAPERDMARIQHGRSTCRGPSTPLSIRQAMRTDRAAAGNICLEGLLARPLLEYKHTKVLGTMEIGRVAGDGIPRYIVLFHGKVAALVKVARYLHSRFG